MEVGIQSISFIYTAGKYPLTSEWRYRYINLEALGEGEIKIWDTRRYTKKQESSAKREELRKRER